MVVLHFYRDIIDQGIDMKMKMRRRDFSMIEKNSEKNVVDDASDDCDESGETQESETDGIMIDAQNNESFEEKMKKMTNPILAELKRNRISVICAVIVVAAIVAYAVSGRNKTPDYLPYSPAEMKHMELQRKIAMVEPDVRTEIELNAIENFLLNVANQFYAPAQAYGAGSQQHRDYEQRVADYRAFHDARRNDFGTSQNVLQRR